MKIWRSRQVRECVTRVLCPFRYTVGHFGDDGSATEICQSDATNTRLGQLQPLSLLLMLYTVQVSNVYLSVPESRRHYSSVMLEVRLPGREASKLSVEGTVADGVPQWVAVDGVEFCRPVRLCGHLLICRGASGCTCTSEQMDTLRGTFNCCTLRLERVTHALANSQFDIY